MFKRKEKILFILFLLPIFILLSKTMAHAKEITLQEGASLRDAVQNAASGDTIILNGKAMVNDTASDSAPWVIDKEITIRGAVDGADIDVRAGGMVLGKNVTFDNVTLVFSNTTRNVIAANGYTLTLNNVTSDSTAQQVHLVCGTMYSDSGRVASATIPQSGSHGKIVVTGTKNISLGNIYAGSLSTTGMAAVSQIPATIEVDVTTNSEIGLTHTDSRNGVTVTAGIYASGATETVGAGITFDTAYVQLPPIPGTTHQVTGAVTMNVKGGVVKKLDGATGGAANATLNFKGGTYAVLNTVTITNFASLHVQEGTLGPAAATDLSNTAIQVSGTSKIGFTYMSNPTIKSLEASGSGTIVLGRSQQLTISETVTGQAKVSVEEYNADTSYFPTLDSQLYIKAPNSGVDSFLLWPYTANTAIQLVNDGAGNWYARVGEKVVVIQSISIADGTAYSDEISKSLPVTVTLADPDDELRFVPADISLNGVPMIKEENAGSYSYRSADGKMEIFFSYGTYGNDVLLIQTLGTTDADMLFTAGSYSISVNIPAKNMENKQNKSIELNFTVRDRNAQTPLTFVDDAAYDLLPMRVGSAIGELDLSLGVTGGVQPYTYTAAGLPEGIGIAADTGIISGTPIKAAGEGTATITVTDQEGKSANITIAVGAVTEAVTPPPAVQTYSITANVDPAEGGSVTKSHETAAKDQSVMLTARANAGWRFIGWESADISIGTPENSSITITMPGNEITVTAKFEEDKPVVTPTELVFADNDVYNLPAMAVGTKIQDINVSSGVTGGTLPYNFTAAGLPEGIGIAADTGIISGTPIKAAGEGTATVRVTDQEGKSANITIAVGAVTEAVTPPPAVQTYKITTAANPAEGGSIKASTSEAQEGQSVKLTITVNAGWKFIGWESTTISIEKPTKTELNFAMPKNEVRITAKFEKLTNQSSTGGSNKPAGGQTNKPSTGESSKPVSGQTNNSSAGGTNQSAATGNSQSSAAGSTQASQSAPSVTTPPKTTTTTVINSQTTGLSANADITAQRNQSLVPASRNVSDQEPDNTEEKKDIPVARWNTTIIGSESKNEQKIYDSTGEEYIFVNESIKEEIMQQIWEGLKNNEDIGQALSEVNAYQMMEIHLKKERTGEKVQPSREVTFLIQYPKGTDSGDEFIIIHLKEGKNPVLLKENSNYIKQEEGISITTESFSPFIIAWKDAALQESEIEEEEAVEEEAKEPLPIKNETEKKSSYLWIFILIVIIALIALVVLRIYQNKMKQDD